MKKKIILIVLALSIILIIGITFPLLFPHKRHQYSYSPQKAIDYSYQYVNERNPQFPNFEGNCITYISQCLVAGGLEMDGSNANPISTTKVRRTSNQWFCYSYDIDPYRPITYYLSSSFSNHQYFVPYWTKCAGVPSGMIQNTDENRNNLKDLVHEGDVIILYGKVVHSALIVKIDHNDIYYNSNTNNRTDYPLSRVDASSYPKIRYLNFVR